MIESVEGMMGGGRSYEGEFGGDERTTTNSPFRSRDSIALVMFRPCIYVHF